MISGIQDTDYVTFWYWHQPKTFPGICHESFATSSDSLPLLPTFPWWNIMNYIERFTTDLPQSVPRSRMTKHILSAFTYFLFIYLMSTRNFFSHREQLRIVGCILKYILQKTLNKICLCPWFCRCAWLYLIWLQAKYIWQDDITFIYLITFV